MADDTTIGAFCPFTYGKGLPEGLRNANGRIPVYGSNGVVGRHDTALTQGATVIIGRKGTVGAVHLCLEPCWPIDTTFYVEYPGKREARFCYYLLKTLGLERMNSDSAVPGLNRDAAHARTITVTDRASREAIASILGALDDKIELNARMNRTLEAMARAIFKSWFVDFDPVRAKMEGRKPSGMDDATAALFPDSFEESDLGLIPKGWRIGSLGEVAESARDGIQADEVEAGTPYIALEHMPRKCIALSDWETADEVMSNKSRFRRDDILFGKLRPYFHKVGIAPVDGVCSTDILVLRPKGSDWYCYVLGHVSSEEFVSYTDSASTGTKMPRTNWRDMAAYQIVIPRAEVAQAFHVIVKPLFNLIVAGIHQSRVLSETRDALLPRLISGEIQVTNPKWV